MFQITNFKCFASAAGHDRGKLHHFEPCRAGASAQSLDKHGLAVRLCFFREKLKQVFAFGNPGKGLYIYKTRLVSDKAWQVLYGRLYFFGNVETAVDDMEP